MRFNTLFFLLILSCLCFTWAQVSYEDCCLKYVKNLANNVQKHAVNYRRQRTDGGCNIPAVIFIMRRGRKFCTDPNEKWVKELVLKIDEKNEKNEKKEKKAGDLRRNKHYAEISQQYLKT
uniref:Chemokine (C-C motif) ligand 25a n=1 Tax=Poecilia reticulata TaxID=8081 RepID=A0A3P9P7D9_POERE